jgi:hypothetical protein
MEELLRQLREQHVTVVETDTKLSDWLNEDEFAAMLGMMTQWNRMCHGAGMKVVWYYPSLEVISPGGQYGPSFYKAYPDWAQLSIKGEPNYFFGGVVFWVEAGNESVWLSPNGPWREYYLDRVKRIAATGADGIWPDVPIYFSGTAEWCDTSPWARAAFKADTGLDIPDGEDWTDPHWRRWIEWRHRNLNQFLLDIAAAGRSVNPDFETFVETVTCDYQDATRIGLDGAYLRLAEGITHVWEVDAISDSTAMRNAKEDDYICQISMYKYCRAASGKKPAWAFDYGLQEDDAQQVMAEVLAAGCNPYEVKIPEKTFGVSAPMRTRMYGWVDAHMARIFDATSLANVALYHSSPSRNYTPQGEGSGLFATTTKPAGVEKWWSTVPEESCYRKQWLSEYRGMVKMLVHAHIPFDVITSPTFRAEDLEGYKLLLLPDLEAVSDGEAAIMRQFVQAGGTIVITGPRPTSMNEYGDSRPNYALADVLGFNKGSSVPESNRNSFGSGAAYYFEDFLGGEYLRQSWRPAYDKVVGAILESVTPIVTVDGDRRIHVEARALGGETILHLTNFIGVTGEFSVVPTQIGVEMLVPAGKQVQSVQVTSPDHETPEPRALDFSAADGKVKFPVDLRQYSVVLINWQ